MADIDPLLLSRLSQIKRTDALDSRLVWNWRKRPRNEADTAAAFISRSSMDTQVLEYQIIDNPRKWFKKGRFFMAFWVEPLGFSQPSASSGSELFSESRRFMVIRSKPGHCLCLSVHTYGGQATAKHGVWADDYAAILSEGGETVLHPEEKKLTKDPIHIILENEGVTIHQTSRIDFSRVYTVEYNIPVRNIGRIQPTDLEILEKYFSSNMNIVPHENAFKTDMSLSAYCPHLASQAGRDHDMIQPTNYLSEQEQEILQKIRTSNDGSPERLALDTESKMWQSMLEFPQYKAWLSNKPSLLWIVGASKSENTSLSKRLVEHEFQQVEWPTICHISFTENDSSKNNWTVALHSLLFQLLSQRPELAEHVRNNSILREKDTESSSILLWEKFLHLTKLASGTVVCVLDGLDECYPRTRRHEVIEFLTNFHRDPKASVKQNLHMSFIVTSKPDDDIEHRFYSFICKFPTNDQRLNAGPNRDASVPKIHYGWAHNSSDFSELNTGDQLVTSHTHYELQGVEGMPDRYNDGSQATCQPVQGSQPASFPTLEVPLMLEAKEPIKPVARTVSATNLVRYRCIYPGCTKDFKRLGDMERHRLAKHTEGGFPCNYPGCDRKRMKAFGRADKLREHRRQKHNVKL